MGIVQETTLRGEENMYCSKRNDNQKKSMMMALCASAVIAGCMGMNSKPAYAYSGLSNHKVSAYVINHVDYYSDGKCYLTNEYHYNRAGLISRIKEYGSNLDDTDQDIFTYKNHRLVSIKVTCPSGKDDSYTDSYTYNRKNHNVATAMEKLTKGSDSDSESYTEAAKFSYNKGSKRINRKYFGATDGYLYALNYSYNKQGYLTNVKEGDDKFSYSYSYDRHGTVSQEGYDYGSSTDYYKYDNTYDGNGRLIQYTYSDTNDDDWKGVSVKISYKKISVNSHYKKALSIQQQYYLRNGKYFDEASNNYLNALADAYK